MAYEDWNYFKGRFLQKTRETQILDEYVSFYEKMIYLKKS